MARSLAQLNLRPGERRLLTAVALVVFLVLNMLLVWPHFGAWRDLQEEIKAARLKLQRYEADIAEIPKLQARIRLLESDQEPLPEEDQGTEFLSTIQRQASLSGVTITGSSRMTTRTNNPFFIERSQTISVMGEERPLLDFLYRTGTAGSMTRIRGLSLRPDPPRHRLTGNITLVASYQKKPSSTTNSPTNTVRVTVTAAEEPTGSPRPVKPLPRPRSSTPNATAAQSNTL